MGGYSKKEDRQIFSSQDDSAECEEKTESIDDLFKKLSDELEEAPESKNENKKSEQTAVPYISQEHSRTYFDAINYLKEQEESKNYYYYCSQKNEDDKQDSQQLNNDIYAVYAKDQKDVETADELAYDSKSPLLCAEPDTIEAKEAREMFKLLNQAIWFFMCEPTTTLRFSKAA